MKSTRQTLGLRSSVTFCRVTVITSVPLDMAALPSRAPSLLQAAGPLRTGSLMSAGGEGVLPAITDPLPMPPPAPPPQLAFQPPCLCPVTQTSNSFRQECLVFTVSPKAEKFPGVPELQPPTTFCGAPSWERPQSLPPGPDQQTCGCTSCAQLPVKSSFIKPSF